MEKSEVEQITVLHRALGQKRRQRYAIPYVVYLQSDGGFTYGWNWEGNQPLPKGRGFPKVNDVVHAISP